MKSLKLDPVTHDLDVSTGNLSFVEGKDYIAQKIKTRLLLIYGEWFLDDQVGVKYRESIWVKNPNMSLIESIIKATILEVEGILEFESFSLRMIPAERNLLVAFTVTTIYGQLYLEESV